MKIEELKCEICGHNDVRLLAQWRSRNMFFTEIQCHWCREWVRSRDTTLAKSKKRAVEFWQFQNDNSKPSPCTCGCQDVKIDDAMKCDDGKQSLECEIACQRCGTKVKFTSSVGRFHSRINAVRMWDSIGETGFQITEEERTV